MRRRTGRQGTKLRTDFHRSTGRLRLMLSSMAVRTRCDHIDTDPGCSYFYGSAAQEQPDNIGREVF